MRLRLLTVTLAFLVPAFAQQTPQVKPCGISGTVLQASDGQPLAKAKVKLEDDNGQLQQDGSTDPTGAFEFTGLACKRYVLTASRVGFLAQSFGERSAWGAGAPISLIAGQQFKGATLRLKATSAITGKVFDADGDPVTGVRVSALRPYWLRGKWLMAQAVDTTNDLGEYRLHDLPPARYYLRAGGVGYDGLGMEIRQFQESTPPTVPQKKLVNVSTFYPGTTDREQATVVEIRPGDEVHIDITMLRQPSATIRGRVIGGGRRTMVMVSGSDETPNASEVKPDGSFEIARVPPGEYSLNVISWPENLDETRDLSDLRRGTAKVKVTDGDVENVVVHLDRSEGSVTVSGRVTAAQSGIDLRKLMVAAVSDEGAEYESGISLSGFARGFGIGRVKADGSFEMKNLRQGHYRVTVRAEDTSLRDWYAQSIRAAGVDVMAEGMRLTGAATTAPLEISVSDAGAQIEGVVVDKSGQPQPGVTVMAIPAAPYRRQEDLYQSHTTDQNGRFVMRGLRPGEYTLLAADGLAGQEYLATQQAMDPEFLAKYESQCKKVTVRAREHASVELPLTVAPIE